MKQKQEHSQEGDLKWRDNLNKSFVQLRQE